MAVTITEILGTDPVSGSRLTINSNFLLLENAYNDLENAFNINVLTGSMDVSSASSGQIKAKTFIGNNMVMPSSGSPTIQIYGTGANAGNIIISNTITGATGTFNNLLTNSLSVTGAAIFQSNVNFNDSVNLNSKFIIENNGNIINKNRRSSVNYTTPFPSPPNSGLTGTYDNPYYLDLTENVIYINSAYFDSIRGITGFFLCASTGPTSLIPPGFTLTLIDTAIEPGLIVTGQTGPNNYYTGFSTTGGNYSLPGIPTPGNPYKSSLTLMWEPRIDGDSLSGPRGSWVIISSTPGFSF